jgi:hypothetical protein
LGAGEVVLGDVFQPQDIGIKIMQTVNVFGHEIDVVKFQLHRRVPLV